MNAPKPFPFVRGAVFASALGAVIALAGIPNADSPLAYTTTGAKFSTPGATYYINPNFTDAAAGNASQQIASIQAAATEWRVGGQCNFQWNYGGTTAVATVGADGVNSVFYSNTDGGGALATCYWWTSGGFTTNFDIRYYDRDGSFNFVWATNPNSSQFDIQSVAVHELGHALGLGHSAVLAATMYPSVSAGSIANRTVDADDAAGAQFLYGYAPPPAPEISTVVPNSGWIDGGMAVQINGIYFTSPVTSVTFGGVPATSVVFVNTTRIDCVVPAGLRNGAANVVVTCGGLSDTLTSGYTYSTCRLLTPPTLGTWTNCEVKLPADAGSFYQGAVSYTAGSLAVSSFGNPSDPRVVPIGYDDFMLWSVFYPNLPYFWEIQGLLDSTGRAMFGIWLPNVPGAPGLVVNFVALSGGASSLSGVSDITNAVTAVFPLN